MYYEVQLERGEAAVASNTTNWCEKSIEIRAHNDRGVAGLDGRSSITILKLITMHRYNVEWVSESNRIYKLRHTV